jgi:hypothetical protein
MSHRFIPHTSEISKGAIFPRKIDAKRKKRGISGRCFGTPKDFFVGIAESEVL